MWIWIFKAVFNSLQDYTLLETEGQYYYLTTSKMQQFLLVTALQPEIYYIIMLNLFKRYKKSEFLHVHLPDQNK